MAGFADGFNQGLNLMFSAKRLSLYEDELELRRANQERLDKPVSEVAPGVATDLGISPDTTFGDAQNVMNLEKTRTDIDASKSRIDYTKGQTDLINLELDPERVARRDNEAELIIDQRKLQNESSELDNIAKQKQYDNSIEYQDAILAENLMNSAFVLANDPEFINSRGTSSYDLVISNLADIYGKSSEKGRTDIVKVFAPEMIQARAAIQPIIKAFRSEDPQALGEVDFEDYNTELNTFFDVKKGQYLGKNFKKADGTTSQVKDVSIDFGSIKATGNGNAILLKGIFVLEDGSEISSYMPDTAAANIVESNKSTDAVSVSMTDMIDITASIDQLLGLALSNPNNAEVFNIMSQVAQRDREMLERGEVSDLIKINVEATREQDRQKDLLNDKWVTTNSQRIATRIGGDNAQRESDAIEQIMTNFEFMADVDVLSETDAAELGITFTKGTGPYYRFKRNEDGSLIKSPLQSAINQNVMPIGDIQTQLKKGTAFEDKSPERPALSSGFVFSKLPDEISRGETLAIALPKIKQAYPSVDVDSYISAVRNSYANRYPNQPPLSDDAILDLLSRNPLLR